MAYEDDLLAQTLLSLAKPPQGGLGVSNAMDTSMPRDVESQMLLDEVTKLINAGVTDGSPIPAAPGKAMPPGRYRTLEDAIAAQDAMFEARGIPKSVGVEPVDQRVMELNRGFSKDDYKTSAMGKLTGASSNKIVASRQANGNISITNVGTEPMQPATLATELTPSKAFNVSNLDARLKELTTIDPNQSSIEFTTKKAALDKDVLDYVTNFKLDVLNTQKTLLGIPQLEARVALAAQQDARMVAQGKPELATNAAALSGQLLKANELAEKQTDAALRSNITINAINNKLKSAESVIGLVGEKTAQGEVNKIKDLELWGTLPPDQANNLKALVEFDNKLDSTSVKTNPNDASQMLGYLKKLPEAGQKAVQASPEMLPNLLLADPNNAVARRLLVAKLTSGGRSDAEAAGIINRMEAVSKDPKLMDRAFANTFRTQEEQNANKAILNTAGGTKAEQENNAMARAEIVKRYLDTEATETFASNVSTWLPVTGDPELQKAYASVMQAGMQPSLANVAKMYIGEDRATAKAKYDALATLVRSQLENRQRSILGNVSKDQVLAMLPNALPSRASGVMAGLESALKPITESVLTNSVEALAAKKIMEGFNFVFDQQQLAP